MYVCTLIKKRRTEYFWNRKNVKNWMKWHKKRETLMHSIVAGTSGRNIPPPSGLRSYQPSHSCWLLQLCERDTLITFHGTQADSEWFDQAHSFAFTGYGISVRIVKSPVSSNSQPVHSRSHKTFRQEVYPTKTQRANGQRQKAKRPTDRSHVPLTTYNL